MNLASQEFEAHLRDSGIVDPDGVHSEFSQIPPLHGQKIDFDKIPDHSAEFDEWVEITAEAVDYYYPGRSRPEVLISVTGGTDRLVGPVAKKLGKGVVGLLTRRNKWGVIVLPPESYRKVNGRKPKLALVVEDVGTTGRNAAHTAYFTQKAGAQDVEALITWRQQLVLPELVRAQIKYNSIIETKMPTFTAEDCKSRPEGFCARGWDLVPYKNRHEA